MKDKGKIILIGLFFQLSFLTVFEMGSTHALVTQEATKTKQLSSSSQIFKKEVSPSQTLPSKKKEQQVQTKEVPEKVQKLAEEEPDVAHLENSNPLIVQGTKEKTKEELEGIVSGALFQRYKTKIQDDYAKKERLEEEMLDLVIRTVKFEKETREGEVSYHEAKSIFEEKKQNLVALQEEIMQKQELLFQRLLQRERLLPVKLKKVSFKKESSLFQRDFVKNQDLFKTLEELQQDIQNLTEKKTKYQEKIAEIKNRFTEEEKSWLQLKDRFIENKQEMKKKGEEIKKTQQAEEHFFKQLFLRLQLSESFQWPLKTNEQTSDFGYRETEPITGVGIFHNGIDLATPMNEPIHASSAGVVAKIGKDTISGNYIILKHSNGYYSYYGHLSLIQVQENQVIDVLEQIGKSGSTGAATGPHLHFGLSKNIWSEYIQPLDQLPKDRTGLFTDEAIGKWNKNVTEEEMNDFKKNWQNRFEKRK